MSPSVTAEPFSLAKRRANAPIFLFGFTEEVPTSQINIIGNLERPLTEGLKVWRIIVPFY